MGIGRIGRVGPASSAGYIPLHDRIFSTIVAKAAKAKRDGHKEAVMMMKDSPALWKAIDAAREYMEVHAQKSDSVKVTVKL